LWAAIWRSNLKIVNLFYRPSAEVIKVETQKGGGGGKKAMTIQPDTAKQSKKNSEIFAVGRQRRKGYAEQMGPEREAKGGWASEMKSGQQARLTKRRNRKIKEEEKAMKSLGV